MVRSKKELDPRVADLALDPAAATPLYLQLATRLAEAIREGA